jgi:GNAT superfamily N-acetyltransferase
MNIELALLTLEEIDDYLALIREVYDEFVAIGYADEGNRTFYDFISMPETERRYRAGNLMVRARVDGAIVGAHEVRDANHIALFFVKKEYHGKGVGRAMFRYTLNAIRERHPDLAAITVNSSPYARGIYRKLGFVETADEQLKNGIRYYPMEYRIE